MVNTKIEVGGREVLDSGIVTAFGNEKIEFTLEPEQKEGEIGSSLSFIFEFTDEENKEAEIETVVLSEERVKFIIKNHRTGTIRFGGVSPRIGPQNEMNIGTFQDRELILSYQVSVRGELSEENTPTDLFYCIYLGGDINE